MHNMYSKLELKSKVPCYRLEMGAGSGNVPGERNSQNTIFHGRFDLLILTNDRPLSTLIREYLE